MSDTVQVHQQWRMARAQLCHHDALISGPVTRPATVRMLHVGKYSVDTRVWIAVISCGGDGVLVGNECRRCRDVILEILVSVPCLDWRYLCSLYFPCNCR